MTSSSAGDLPGKAPELSVRNTFLDLGDGLTIAERWDCLRRVRSCDALCSLHGDMQRKDDLNQMSPSTRSKESGMELQQRRTAIAFSRTQLSSGAKMPQPRLPGASTTYYAMAPRLMPCQASPSNMPSNMQLRGIGTYFFICSL